MHSGKIVFFFIIHCNPSLAYIAVRYLQSNASVCEHPVKSIANTALKNSNKTVSKFYLSFFYIMHRQNSIVYSAYNNKVSKRSREV